MPAILYGIGALALFVGLVMIGFGIPINEFSFGNTLISAGTTAGVGGLIIVGLGVVAGQLRRLAEALGVQLPSRLGQPMEASESAGAARPIPPSGRVPFPPRPQSEAYTSEAGAMPSAAPMAFEDKLAATYAPTTLPNPDESSVSVEDEISLTPRRPVAPAVQAGTAVTRPSAAPTLGDAGSSMYDRNRDPTTGWPSTQLPQLRLRPRPGRFTAPTSTQCGRLNRNCPRLPPLMRPGRKHNPILRRATLPPYVANQKHKNRVRPRSSNQVSSMEWAIRCMLMVQSKRNCRKARCVLLPSMSCAVTLQRTQRFKCQISRGIFLFFFRQSHLTNIVAYGNFLFLAKSEIG